MSKTSNLPDFSSSPKGVRTVQQYRNWLSKHGVDGFCLDLLDLLADGGKDFHGLNDIIQEVKVLHRLRMIVQVYDKKTGRTMLTLAENGKMVTGRMKSYHLSELGKVSKSYSRSSSNIKQYSEYSLEDYLYDELCDYDSLDDLTKKYSISKSSKELKSAELKSKNKSFAKPGALDGLLDVDAAIVAKVKLDFTIDLNRDGLVETLRKIFLAFRYRSDRATALEESKYLLITEEKKQQPAIREDLTSLNVKLLKRSIRGGFGSYASVVPTLPPLQITESKVFFKKRKVS